MPFVLGLLDSPPLTQFWNFRFRVILRVMGVIVKVYGSRLSANLGNLEKQYMKTVFIECHFLFRKGR